MLSEDWAAVCFELAIVYFRKIKEEHFARETAVLPLEEITKIKAGPEKLEDALESIADSRIREVVGIRIGGM
jgi:hypothetical protein